MMEPIIIGGTFASGVAVTVTGAIIVNSVKKWMNGKNGKPCKKEHCEDHQELMTNLGKLTGQLDTHVDIHKRDEQQKLLEEISRKLDRRQ